jgi:glycosyltransferase involved in cell wall biosynthesis
MTRLKILMIIPNLGFGGAQRVFHDLSICLRESFEVTECVFNLDDGHAYPSPNKIVSLDVPGGKSVIQKCWFFLKRVQRLKSLKRQLQIDVAISHLEGADYINILSARKERVFLCVHGSKKYDTAITGSLGWIRKSILLPLLYRRSSKIVTVAQGIKDELITHFKIPPKKVTVINNGFNLKEIKSKVNEIIPNQYDFIFKRPMLITHGRLAKEKNHRFLLTLLSHKLLKDKMNLVLIGDGPLLNELAAYSESLGHKTHIQTENDRVTNEIYDVIFLGYQSNPFKFLKRASVFVFPSIFEGFPMALVEAMACELPVIARDCPYGPREILAPDASKVKGLYWTAFGGLVSEGEELELDVWAKGIAEILANELAVIEYKTKSGLRAADFAMDKFNKSWTVLINETIARK